MSLADCANAVQQYTAVERSPQGAGVKEGRSTRLEVTQPCATAGRLVTPEEDKLVKRGLARQLAQDLRRRW